MKQEFSYKGLNDAQVAESRSKHGSNILTPPTKTPVWKQFLEKFRDPLIVILLIAGVLSICISIYEHLGLGKSIEVFFEPVGIFVAIFLATGLAFYFEYKAGKEFDILNRINDDEPVEVVRNGNVTRIARRNVVVGDLVLINTGEEIAADGELLQSVRLQIDESSLTGEPICIKSCREEDFDPEATYPTNHVLKGTKVMEGHGKMIVTAVGDKTEQGKVFVASQIDDGKKTPFNEQLDRLGVWISRLSYAIAFAIVVCRIILYLLTYGTDFFDSFQHATPFIAYVLQTLMIAVTLIVVAVPEGLPMAITLSLAYSMRRMLKTNNLVRKLHSCETMGATTVICTDKTGTLTQNRMKVNSMKIFNTNVPHELICEGIAVNSTASIDFTQADKPQVMGNPTEGALLMWLINNGTDYRTIRNSTSVVEELPFTTERKYMATVVNSTAMPGKKILYIKGAPEIVFEMSDYKADDKTEVYKQLDDFQRHAMRTLGFAYKILAYDETPIINDTITSRNISFIGVAAISDPVRTDVANAIKECTNAGINIKIVTGDTPLTAMEIGRQIGLWTNRDNESSLISGTEFAALSDKELSERVEKLKIIARARPMDKKRLVEALQKKDHVVAVTGDGTNDAPALKAAHVGLSMGDGTSVAKEASDITIIDNSFSSIGKAVMWGRSLYKNIQRFILFQLTVNVTACFLVLCGAFMGTESPLTVTQMLWINLIMDTFAAMALASLPPSQSVMLDKPRDRHAFILNKSMITNIVGVGGFFFLLLLVLLYVFQHSDIRSLTDLLFVTLGRKGHVTTYELTLLFTIFVMTHFFYLFNSRAYETGRSALHFKGCKGLLTIATIIFVGQIAMVELPGLQKFFNVCSLSLKDWVIIIAASSLVMWVREGYHLLKTRKIISPSHVDKTR